MNNTILSEHELVKLGFSKKLMPGTGWNSISSMCDEVYYYTNNRLTINATEIWTWFLDNQQRNDIAVSTTAELIQLLNKLK